MNGSWLDTQGRGPNPSSDLRERPPGYILRSRRRWGPVDLLLLAWSVSGQHGRKVRRFGLLTGHRVLHLPAIRALRPASAFHLLPEMESSFLGRGEDEVSRRVVDINLLCFCHSFRLGRYEKNRNETSYLQKQEAEVRSVNKQLQSHTKGGDHSGHNEGLQRNRTKREVESKRSRKDKYNPIFQFCVPQMHQLFRFVLLDPPLLSSGSPSLCLDDTN